MALLVMSLYLMFPGDLDSGEKLLPLNKSTRIPSLETGLFHSKEAALNELPLPSHFEVLKKKKKERQLQALF